MGRGGGEKSAYGALFGVKYSKIVKVVNIQKPLNCTF